MCCQLITRVLRLLRLPKHHEDDLLVRRVVEECVGEAN